MIDKENFKFYDIPSDAYSYLVELRDSYIPGVTSWIYK